jgi:hypothetical protein
MRLDRLLPLPTPVHQPGRKEERPPRRQPEDAERRATPEPPAPESPDPGGERPTSPDHLDITV